MTNTNLHAMSDIESKLWSELDAIQREIKTLDPYAVFDSMSRGDLISYAEDNNITFAPRMLELSVYDLADAGRTAIQYDAGAYYESVKFAIDNFESIDGTDGTIPVE